MGRMYTKKTICYLSEIQKYNLALHFYLLETVYSSPVILIFFFPLLNLASIYGVFDW